MFGCPGEAGMGVLDVYENINAIYVIKEDRLKAEEVLNNVK